jgi:ABC-2 type transport system permease protein
VNELVARLALRYRYPRIILREMVVTDFKLRYQASFLGYLWTLLRPLALFGVLYEVFSRFHKFGAGIPHYSVILLFGIVIWGFFSEATMQGLASLVGRADLLRKINFPRWVVVLSVGASAIISLGLNMVVIVLFMILGGLSASFQVLWLVPLFLQLVALSVALALFLSALFVRFRDVSYIWEVALQAGFYAAPILYPLSMVQVHSLLYARLLMLNPMAQIIQDARYALLSRQTETIASVYGTQLARAIPVGITLVLVVTSVLFFRRRAPSFAEEA